MYIDSDLNHIKRNYHDLLKSTTLSQIDDFMQDYNMSRTDALLFCILLEIKDQADYLDVISSDVKEIVDDHSEYLDVISSDVKDIVKNI